MNGHSTNPRDSGRGRGAQNRGSNPYKKTEIQVDSINDDWIKVAITDEAIDYCERYGKELAKNKLTTSQIRNFYGEVMRIKGRGFDREKEAVLMLRPKLAYASFRKDTKGSEMLNKILQPALKLASQNEKAFLNFCQMFEALLAFHKANGGKD